MEDLKILIQAAMNNSPVALSCYLVYFVTNRLERVLDRVGTRLETLEGKIDACPRIR